MWECPTTSLSENTMVMLARATVIIRGGPSLPGAWPLAGSTVGTLTWIKTTMKVGDRKDALLRAL